MSARTKISGFHVTGFVVGVAIAVLSTSGVRAGDAPVDEIVVSAARTAQPASGIAGTVTVLPPEQIEARAAISDDLASVLSASVPGFAPSSQKLAGRGETLRGRNPLYLIDGVPQHNALRDGQRDGHTIDLAFVERIEVINGSNALQGVGATGGVVNLVTRSVPNSDTWTGRFDARLTSADDFGSDGLGTKLSGTVGRRIGAVDVLFGAAWHERGLFFDADGDPVGLYPTQGDIMDSQSLSLFGKAAWQINDASSLTLLVNDFDLERNGDFRVVRGDRALGQPTTTEPGDPSDTVGDPARNEVTTVSLTYTHAEVLGGALDVQVFDQSYRALFEGGEFGGFFRLTPAGAPFLDQSAIESDKHGLKTTWNRRFDDPGVGVSLGVDWFEDSSSQVLARSGREWVPETAFTSVAPFAQLSWNVVDALTLAAGVRREDAELDVSSYVTIAAAGSTAVGGGTPEFSETLLNASAVWRIAEQWRAYASFSEGFTMPDVGRVLRGVNTPGLSVDTLIDLEPIVTDNLELGLEWQSERASARVALWQSEAENGARLRSNPAGIFEVVRQKTEIDGIEISGEVALTNNITLGANLAFTNGEFDSDGNGSIDSDLDGLNIGPDRLNVYLNGSTGDAWRWRLQASHLRDRDFDGPGAPVDRDFDGYTVVDAFIARRLPVGELSLGIENLLNEDTFTYFAQTEPFARTDTYFKANGRTLSLGWQLTL